MCKALGDNIRMGDQPSITNWAAVLWIKQISAVGAYRRREASVSRHAKTDDRTDAQSLKLAYMKEVKYR